MSIYRSAVEHPVTTALLFIALAILGVFSLSRTSIALLPEFDSNTIMVMASYQGANAQEMPLAPGVALAHDGRLFPAQGVFRLAVVLESAPKIGAEREIVIAQARFRDVRLRRGRRRRQSAPAEQ